MDHVESCEKPNVLEPFIKVLVCWLVHLYMHTELVFNSTLVVSLVYMHFYKVQSAYIVMQFSKGANCP